MHTASSSNNRRHLPWSLYTPDNTSPESSPDSPCACADRNSMGGWRIKHIHTRAYVRDHSDHVKKGGGRWGVWARVNACTPTSAKSRASANAFGLQSMYGLVAAGATYIYAWSKPTRTSSERSKSNTITYSCVIFGLVARQYVYVLLDERAGGVVNRNLFDPASKIGTIGKEGGALLVNVKLSSCLPVFVFRLQACACTTTVQTSRSESANASSTRTGGGGTSRFRTLTPERVHTHEPCE